MYMVFNSPETSYTTLVTAVIDNLLLRLSYTKSSLQFIYELFKINPSENRNIFSDIFQCQELYTTIKMINRQHLI